MQVHWPQRIVRFFFGDLALFFRYIGIGALSALLELALFSVAYQYASLPLFLANNGALALAVLFNFAAQRHWTFRVQGGFSRQIRSYVMMQTISALLNNLFVYLLIARWGWFAPLAKFTQIGLVFVWNFSFCKLIVFSNPSATMDPPNESMCHDDQSVCFRSPASGRQEG